MNILGNNNIGLPNNLIKNIQQLKQMKNMFSGNPQALMTQLMNSNPQFAQMLQGMRGQNPENIVRQMCQQKGIDFNAFMSELQK